MRYEAIRDSTGKFSREGPRACRTCGTQENLIPERAYCKSCVKEVRKKYDTKYINGKGKNRKRGMYKLQYKLKHLYGLSLEDVREMHKRQEGKCAICEQELFDTYSEPQTKGRKAFPPNVDHNHEYGYTRDLLCDRCNKGLGCFKENARLLQLASWYIKRHSLGDEFLCKKS